MKKARIAFIYTHNFLRKEKMALAQEVSPLTGIIAEETVVIDFGETSTFYRYLLE